MCQVVSIKIPTKQAKNQFANLLFVVAFGWKRASLRLTIYAIILAVA